MYNKKTITKLLALLLIMAIIVTGCGDQSGDTTAEEPDSQETVTETNDNESEEENVEDTVKVTYYDGDGETVIEEREIVKGETPEEIEGVKEGYEFLGWYATPQMSHRFDFTKPIEEDTDIYGGFTEYVEDTREFYILGDGKSDLLSQSDWGAVIDDNFKLEKLDEDNENLYRITLDLEERDEFQFAINESWNNQRGYGYLDTIEKDNEEYFENSGGLGDTAAKKSNIKVKVPGTYTFTLKTHPAEDYYDEEDEFYSEDNKENFNYNPYDVITWTYEE